MSVYIIDKLITDFDETISEADTIQLLVYAAAENREHDRTQTWTHWKETVEWYTTKYTHIVDEWLDNHDSRQLSIVDFLKAFETLEIASIRRVMRGRFLEGLYHAQLRQLGREIQKRQGVESIFTAMRKADVTIEILSANWSQTLVEGAVEGLCDRVTANRLVFGTNQLKREVTPRSTGEIKLNVVSAHDKLRHFRDHRSKTGQTAYIGDSISDLLAMLEADVGILIGENRTALRTIERFQIPTMSIADCLSKKITDKKTILHTHSWETLDCFLKRKT